jgi:transposase InsO family protein
MKRLQALCQLSTPAIVSVARRCSAPQEPRRTLERDVRNAVAGYSREIAAAGLTLLERADLLQLTPRTLRQWEADLRCADVRHMHCRAHLLGRPLLRSSPQLRNDVLAVLDELGPATGLPTLRDCFPVMPRAELQDLLRRYRRVWQHRHHQAPHRLTWSRPGSVWAIDFTEALHPIDGLYPYLLAVRDLASGQQLLWLPVTSATAAVTVSALASLFACHGAPLVLKMDNGSSFLAEATQGLLQAAGVVPLFSPPRLPRYNGSIEAGIGSLKTRTETQATYQGRPGHWTCDDAAAAQEEANATARPRGPQGPTPDQLWATRTPHTPEERSFFQATVERRRTEARTEAGHSQDKILTPSAARAIDRQAIRRALVEHGYLLFKRRRIPLPIKKQKVSAIR